MKVKNEIQESLIICEDNHIAELLSFSIKCKQRDAEVGVSGQSVTKTSDIYSTVLNDKQMLMRGKRGVERKVMFLKLQRNKLKF